MSFAGWEKYKILDIFSGAGGFSLGFKKYKVYDRFPFELAGAVENDRNAVNTLVAAMIREGLREDDARRRVVCGDITLDETKNQLYDVCPVVDIILGGPPCQSFSTIGPRSGDKEKQQKFSNDQRDNLFFHYIEIVKHYRPQFFVFENVRGILSKRSHCGGKYIDIITEAFIELGYTLESENSSVDKPYILLNAVDYGVAQSRERVFIIGNRLGLTNPYPAKTHCSSEKSVPELLPYVTLREVIGDLPPVMPKITMTPAKKGAREKDMPVKTREKILKKNESRFNGEDPVSYHWDQYDRHYKSCCISGQRFLDFVRPENRDTELTGHVARGQQRSDILLFKGMDEGMSAKHLFESDRPHHKRLRKLIKYGMGSFRDKYKKLCWDKPCGTVFAHMQKDGNRFIHPDSAQGRTLTVREAARIQSFPDDYVFEAIGHVRYKYIGNAVPPLIARAIAESVYKKLSEATERLTDFGYENT